MIHICIHPILAEVKLNQPWGGKASKRTGLSLTGGGKAEVLLPAVPRRVVKLEDVQHGLRVLLLLQLGDVGRLEQAGPLLRHPLCRRHWCHTGGRRRASEKVQAGCSNRRELTVNSPVTASKPTCMVCSKSEGGEISGRSLSRSFFLPPEIKQGCWHHYRTKRS